MRITSFAALTAAALFTSPAAARDGAVYVGIEGGILAPRNLDHDVTAFVDGVQAAPTIDSGVDMDLKRGSDLDIIAGYDFGFVRAEAEFAYKNAKVDDIDLDLGALNPAFSGPVDSDGKVRVTSLMGNLLVDFGRDPGVSFYAGGGFGRARVSMRDINLGDSGLTVDEKDSAAAYQLIAGVRAAISENIDIGLKYRYFRTGRLKFNDVTGTGPGLEVDTRTRFSSNSLLASLIFNFGAPAPAEAPVAVEPPPPPPAAPQTQTCPDGSVILATDVCPAPPPPPPPPPAPVGERG